jgi:hypothetical protein
MQVLRICQCPAPEEAGKKLAAGKQKAIEERYWNVVFVLLKIWNPRAQICKRLRSPRNNSKE